MKIYKLFPIFFLKINCESNDIPKSSLINLLENVTVLKDASSISKENRDSIYRIEYKLANYENGNYIINICIFILKDVILFFLIPKIAKMTIDQFGNKINTEGLLNTCFVCIYLLTIFNFFNFDFFNFELQFNLVNFLRNTISTILGLGILIFFYFDFSKKKKMSTRMELENNRAKKFILCMFLNDLICYGIKFLRWKYIHNSTNLKTEKCIKDLLENVKFNNKKITNNLTINSM
jgi:hypothetical protein